MGARRETFTGLAGVGDLIVTCTSMHSRNRRAGILIGQGRTPEEAMSEVGAVVEGYYAARSAHLLASRLGAELPITAAAYQVLYKGCLLYTSVGGVNPDVYEFYALGLGDPLEVSAVHGHGTGDLLDWCVDHFPEAAPQEEDETLTRVAIVGRPNVGKSSLLNRILGEERVIVSDAVSYTHLDVYKRQGETGLRRCYWTGPGW